jgi:hypothetical protein
MTQQRPAIPLEHALIFDAATCLLMGAILTVGASALASPLGIPGFVLTGAGLLLFPCAAVMLAAARVPSLTIALGWLVVFGNIAWVLGSLALLLIAPVTLAGEVFVLVQATAVALIAAAEWQGLRSTPRPRPAHG